MSWERPAVWLQSMTKTHKQMSTLMHTDGTTAKWYIDLLAVPLLVSFIHLLPLDSVKTNSISPSTVRWSFPLCLSAKPWNKRCTSPCILWVTGSQCWLCCSWRSISNLLRYTYADYYLKVIKERQSKLQFLPLITLNIHIIWISLTCFPVS